MNVGLSPVTTVSKRLLSRNTEIGGQGETTNPTWKALPLWLCCATPVILPGGGGGGLEALSALPKPPARGEASVTGKSVDLMKPARWTTPWLSQAAARPLSPPVPPR